MRHGNGIFIDRNNGIHYKGQFKYGQRHGRGTQIYKDGTVYEGEWQFDRFDGGGTLTFKDGSKFTGFFVNGVCSSKTLTIEGFDYQLSISKNEELNLPGMSLIVDHPFTTTTH